MVTACVRDAVHVEAHLLSDDGLSLAVGQVH